MSVRAEKLLWEKIPEGKWLSQAELREIMISAGGFGGGCNPQAMGDQAIRWLLDGKYILVRDAVKRRPLRPGAYVGLLPQDAPPRWEYCRNSLPAVPFEADLQKVAEETARAVAQAKAARNEPLDRRLRELGLLTDEAKTTLQEASCLSPLTQP